MGEALDDTGSEALATAFQSLRQVVEERQRLGGIGGGPAGHRVVEIPFLGGCGELDHVLSRDGAPAVVEVAPIAAPGAARDELLADRHGILGRERLQQTAECETAHDGVRIARGLLGEFLDPEPVQGGNAGEVPRQISVARSLCSPGGLIGAAEQLGPHALGGRGRRRGRIPGRAAPLGAQPEGHRHRDQPTSMNHQGLSRHAIIIRSVSASAIRELPPAGAESPGSGDRFDFPHP